MHFIPLLGLTAATVAAAQERGFPPAPEDYKWDLIHWQAGQSHGTTPPTSWYMFNVTVPSYGADSSYIPPFQAHCEGSGHGQPLGSNYSRCTTDARIGSPDSVVLARIVPHDNIKARIAINHLFYADDDTKTRRKFAVTVVEDWARERLPHDFTVTPAQAP
ncbi:hypothetical protein F5B20DRAFT_580700 [Whalleya microplaca]|nr:hypothetical protein F5B20DRAFT_580700 [Whalleya microplaca]